MAAAPAAEAEGGAGHGGEGAAETGPGSPMGSPHRRDAAAEPPWPWGEERGRPRLPLARCPGTSHRATSPSPPGRGGPNPPPRAVGSPPGSLGAARGRRLSPAVPAGGCRDAPGSFGAPTMERDRRATNVGVGPGPDPRGGDLWCVSTVGEKVRGSPAAAPSFHLHPSPFIPFHPRPSPRTAWLCYGPVFPRNRAWQR